jgi:hypothetical protein
LQIFFFIKELEVFSVKIKKSYLIILLFLFVGSTGSHEVCAMPMNFSFRSSIASMYQRLRDWGTSKTIGISLLAGTVVLAGCKFFNVFPFKKQLQHNQNNSEDEGTELVERAGAAVPERVGNMPLGPEQFLFDQNKEYNATRSTQGQSYPAQERDNEEDEGRLQDVPGQASGTSFRSHGAGAAGGRRVSFGTLSIVCSENSFPELYKLINHELQRVREAIIGSHERMQSPTIDDSFIVVGGFSPEEIKRRLSDLIEVIQSQLCVTTDKPQLKKFQHDIQCCLRTLEDSSQEVKNRIFQRNHRQCDFIALNQQLIAIKKKVERLKQGIDLKICES